MDRVTDKKSLVILVDNYDSFTYTIKSYFLCLGLDVEVIKNDDPRLNKLDELSPNYVLLSPGPGCPNESGLTLQVIEYYHTLYPILGICLGHQCLLQHFGGSIIAADEVMHGKVSKLSHTSEGLFVNIPQNIQVTRYHSLVVDNNTIPAEFAVTAWTYDKRGKLVIMACQHKQLPLFGVQYHPEAILTEYGNAVFENFLNSPGQGT